MWSALTAAILLVAPAPHAAAPPPSRIVFASARTGVAQLYSVEPSGDGLAQLTFGTDNWGFPVPSPDGRFIAAFSGPNLWLRDVGEPVPAPRPELWVMRADGSGARLVSPNAAWASWSSDSRRLDFFVEGTGSTYTVAVAGGRPKLITSLLPKPFYGTSPTPSPDGRSIAFFRADRFSISNVVVRRNRRERTIARGVGGRILWSPNGKWLAIRDRDTLAVVRASGGVVNNFFAVPSPCAVDCIPPEVAWSPDSRRLAFETGDGIEVAAPSRPEATLLFEGLTHGLAWSPSGDAVAFAVRGGVRVTTLDGHIGDIVSSGPGELQWGVGWSPGQPLPYRTPEDAALARVSGGELEARVPIRQFSADGDRVAYWLCQHSFGAWRPGEAPVVLGPGTVAACLVPAPDLWSERNAYDLTLAGDRLAYLNVSGVTDANWVLWLTTLKRGDEGVSIAGAAISSSDSPRWAPLRDLVGGGSTLVYGQRGHPSPYGPEAVWRIDGAKPIEVASRSDDYRPLAVDDDRIVARRTDGSLDLLSLDGRVLETFDVPSLGAVLDGDDLVVLVQGELRDYSASTGELRYVRPLTGGPNLTLDDAARGVVVYTLDGVVHLLRLRDGADRTVPLATAAELTDAGLYYAYPGAEPWPGRIRFVPFDELPL